MGKAAAKSKTTTTTAVSDLEQLSSSMFAKQQFLTTALNMGWQLAVAVLVPLLIGIWLDKKFNSSPSYTIVAFMIAVGCGAMVVWRTVQGVNQDLAEENTKKKGKKK